jgi:hypothetical protein
MAEKTPVMNLISPSWFKDLNRSSIWIVGYRMMQVALKDFTQGQRIIDLGDVRAIFNYGSLSYMDASNIFEFGTDHVRSTNYSKFESKVTNIGGWTILITPYVSDGVQRSEPETRNSISVAEGLLSALNSPNMVYEKVYENIVELSPIKTTAFSPTVLTINQPPNLQPPALQLLSQASVNLQAFPENVRNRVKLSLRWYSKSLVKGLDGFLSIWIAIEVIGMPDTSNVKSAVESLAKIYQVDYRTAVNRFQLGRIQDFRSKIVHDGKMFPIHSLLILYLEAIYVDLLMETLNLPHGRRAEQVLNNSQFDLLMFRLQRPGRRLASRRKGHRMTSLSKPLSPCAGHFGHRFGFFDHFKARWSPARPPFAPARRFSTRFGHTGRCAKLHQNRGHDAAHLSRRDHKAPPLPGTIAGLSKSARQHQVVHGRCHDDTPALELLRRAHMHLGPEQILRCRKR